MTTKYLTNDSVANTATWVATPIPVTDGGTGATTQTAALAAVLGSSAIPIVNGGTGSTATPLTSGDIWYSPDGITMAFLRAPAPSATLVSRVLTLTSDGTTNSLAWVGS